MGTVLNQKCPCKWRVSWNYVYSPFKLFIISYPESVQLQMEETRFLIKLISHRLRSLTSLIHLITITFSQEYVKTGWLLLHKYSRIASFIKLRIHTFLCLKIKSIFLDSKQPWKTCIQEIKVFITFCARVSRLTRFWIIFLVLNNIDIFETKNHLMSIVSTLARKIYVYARLYLIPDLNNKIIIKYMFTQSSELWILYSVQ